MREAEIIEKFLTLETLCDARAHPYPPPQKRSVTALWHRGTATKVDASLTIPIT